MWSGIIWFFGSGKSPLQYLFVVVYLIGLHNFRKLSLLLREMFNLC